MAEVQRQTLYFGEPLPWPLGDVEALLHYWVDYYALHEPEAGAVIEADDGRVVGYRAGATKLAEQARWQRREALRLAVLWASHWRRYDAATRLYYRLRIKDALESLHEPALTVDADMHWNVLPEVRGRVAWEFMRQWRDWMAARGLRTFRAGLTRGDFKGADAGWRRRGLDVVHTARHHTLSVLSGRSVWRVTYVADITRLRV